MRVDVWSDIACPWCAIGKRRFEAALDRLEESVEVTWHSFLLDPNAPPDHGEPQDVLLARKYGCSVDEARSMDARMTAEAAKEGLTFRFDLMRVGSTFEAHRLHHLATSHGLGEAMMERLMRAYLEEGVLMADPEALVRLGTEVGLSECDVRFMLAGNAFTDEVRADLEEAQTLGISGVPFFVLEGKYGVSGAQPTETLHSILQEVGSKVCGPDGCAV